MLNDPREFFAKLNDPRRQNKNLYHPLENVIFIALTAFICGYNDWVSVEDFAKENRSWFEKVLNMPYGIPSHDTFGNVMKMIDKDHFALCFAHWMTESVKDHTHIAIDGKFLQGGFKDTDSIHLVTAFASETKLVLAQTQVNSKDNEITTLPRLLDMINLKGSVVTGDAMYCQKDVCKQLVKAKADYILSLKRNHELLYDDVKLWLDTQFDSGNLPINETVDKDHGRIEVRRYALSTKIDWLDNSSDWTGLSAVAMVESTRIIGEDSHTERRYYLTSLTDLPIVAQYIRSHWAIENSQHWVLDVTFGEDHSVKLEKNARSNKALLTRTALNLLRDRDDTKLSVKRRRIRASQNLDYREQVLFGRVL